MQVSVLLLTYNEAANLPRCLHALRWCGDVVVVDSGSTDDTVAIAEAAGARVLTRPFDDFARQRNHGLANGGLRHDWVLHLDADEVVTDGFVRRLAGLEPPPGILAYRVPSKLMLHGRWLRRAGMYPTYQVRLGHRTGLRFVQVGHGQREDLPSQAVGTFDEPYLHYNFSHGAAAWLRKHVSYAQAEAELLAERPPDDRPPLRAIAARDATERRRALKAMSRHVPLALRPLLRFCEVYVLRRGFLDGYGGFTYAFMLSTYEAMIAICTFDRRR
ncbi:glycosyltransferase family 2 protein [Acuticoccus sp.]|uniref:glycosyltransferase family 2 protein n=1 Tax=Acuticoccus sp. TaxID=1904378 RepID=UPI003B52FD9F